MSKNKKHGTISDEFILEFWQALQVRPRVDKDIVERNKVAVEKLKEKESKEWRDTTNDKPLFKD